MKHGRRHVEASKTNAQWSEETRGVLLRVARVAFATHGFDGVSLDALAESASLTRGAVHHHFGDKRGLFRAVFEELEREIVEQVEAAAEHAPSVFEGIARGCEAFIDAALAKGVVRIVLLDGPRVLGWSTWRAIDAELGGRSLRTGLEVAMRRKEIDPVDPEALMLLLSGALNETALALAESPDRTRARRLASVALRRLLEGLKPEGGTGRPHASCRSR